MRSEFHVSECKSITDAINEVIHEKYDRFMYLFKHFPSLSIDFPICKMRCKLSSTERPYQIMWPLTVADTLRNRNCIFQSTLHSCVIHTSRIEFWWLQTWYCLSFYSYQALINYSYPLANEIIGKFCRVSALTPAFISLNLRLFPCKGLMCKMICGAVNRIFAYYRSLNCSQIIKKQRQECLSSDNNN